MFLLVKAGNEDIEKMYNEFYNITNRGIYDIRQGDAGFDIMCPCDILVPANARSFKIPLGIAIEDKEGSHMDMRPRSSMGSKTPLRLCNSVGTIDYSYRGELIACVDNVSYPPEDYQVTKGQRLVQITGWNNNRVKFKFTDSLGETERNIGGFGSTGK
jgi:dUTP pyrophosphatase